MRTSLLLASRKLRAALSSRRRATGCHSVHLPPPPTPQSRKIKQLRSPFRHLNQDLPASVACSNTLLCELCAGKLSHNKLVLVSKSCKSKIEIENHVNRSQRRLSGAGHFVRRRHLQLAEPSTLWTRLIRPLFGGWTSFRRRLWRQFAATAAAGSEPPQPQSFR